MTNKKTLLFINVLISLGLLTFLSFERYDILSDIVKFLDNINRPPSIFSVNFIDVIIVGSIPLWTMPIYMAFKKNSLGQIFLTNILTFLILVAVTIICYSIGDILTDKPSPYLPDFPVYVPFSNYQTFSLIIGVILTYTIFIFYLRRTKKLPDIKK